MTRVFTLSLQLNVVRPNRCVFHAGLDPAGPLFENRDWTCGLNPSSADLVDVLHTNGEPGVVLNLGTMKVLGHVDFYPNGGGRQPECLLDPRMSPAELRRSLAEPNPYGSSSGFKNAHQLVWFGEALRRSLKLKVVKRT